MSSTASFNQWSFHALGFAEPVDPWPTWPLVGSFVLHVAVGIAVMSMRLPSVIERSESSYQVLLVASPAQVPMEFHRLAPVPDVASLPPMPQQPVEPVAIPDQPEISVQRGEETRRMEEVLTQPVQSVRIPAQPSARASRPVPRVPERVPYSTEGSARVVPPEPPRLTGVPIEQEPMPVPSIAPSVTPKAERERREPAAKFAIPDLSLSKTMVIHQPDFSSTVSSAAENRYWKQIRGRIHEQWTASEIDHSRSLQVVLVFRVERTGQVQGLTVKQSSRNSEYDATVKRAVAAVSPFPPFPPTMTEPYRDITFTFKFQWVQ